MLHYEDETLGYAFDLPDTWSKMNLAFKEIPPSARFKSAGRMLEVTAFEVEDFLVDVDSRRQYFPQLLRHEGYSNATLVDHPTALGGESNTLVAELGPEGSLGCLISCVRGDIQYLITFKGALDPGMKSEIARFMASFNFPPENHLTELRERVDNLPAGQRAVGEAIFAQNAEEAHRVLAKHGIEPMGRVGDSTLYDLEPAKRGVVAAGRKRPWWRLW